MSEITTTSSLFSNKISVVIAGVTGFGRQGRVRRSNYTIKVPYERMLLTMQRLKRLGDKIVSVKICESSLVSVDLTPPFTVKVKEFSQKVGKDQKLTPKLKRSGQTKRNRQASRSHKVMKVRKGRNKPKSQRRASLQA